MSIPRKKCEALALGLLVQNHLNDRYFFYHHSNCPLNPQKGRMLMTAQEVVSKHPALVDELAYVSSQNTIMLKSNLKKDTFEHFLVVTKRKNRMIYKKASRNTNHKAFEEDEL